MKTKLITNRKDLKMETNNEMNLTKFNAWQREQLFYLLNFSIKIEYGFCESLNYGIYENTGNVWIASEFEIFSLYVEYGSKLTIDCIRVKFYNYETAENCEFYLNKNLANKFKIENQIAKIKIEKELIVNE